MSWLLSASLVIACRVLIALVFASAALGKVRHLQEFVGVVANYRLLPQRAAPAFAIAVVLVEATVALSMPLDATARAGGLVGAAALGAFAFAISVNLARGRTEIDCGCFQGALRQSLSLGLLVRNAALALIALWAALPLAPIAKPIEVIDGVAAGLVLFVLYRAAGQLVSNSKQASIFLKRFA